MTYLKHANLVLAEPELLEMHKLVEALDQLWVAVSSVVRRWCGPPQRCW